jgi:hypothetical protein
MFAKRPCHLHDEANKVVMNLRRTADDPRRGSRCRGFLSDHRRSCDVPPAERSPRILLWLNEFQIRTRYPGTLSFTWRHHLQAHSQLGVAGQRALRRCGR